MWRLTEAPQQTRGVRGKLFMSGAAVDVLIVNTELEHKRVIINDELHFSSYLLMKKKRK